MSTVTPFRSAIPLRSGSAALPEWRLADAFFHWLEA